jgi:hypothetical protein
MTSPKLKLPEIPEAALTPWVQQRLRIILRQQEQIEELQEELRRVKGHKGKPSIRASRMDRAAQAGGEGKEGKERKRGPQRAKTAQLQTVDEVIAPEGLPTDAREQGWRFKGYADYGVQERVIEARNVRYRLEEWQGPQGQWLRGKLPASVNGHYGPEWVSYVLHPHPHQHVTQPLLWEPWHEFRIEISAGPLSPLLTQEQELFHPEKAQGLVLRQPGFDRGFLSRHNGSRVSTQWRLQECLSFDIGSRSAPRSVKDCCSGFAAVAQGHAC